jgi:hypothetical protein
MARRPAAILVALAAPAFAAAVDQSGYVGSKVCGGCHRKIFESYSKVAMAHSMVPAKDAAPLESGAVTVVSDALKRTFRVYREGGEVYQSESETDAGGKTVFRTAYRLEFAIGSGVNGYSYAVRRGNHLFEAPLSYYARAGKWDVSPGYEQVDQGFQRPLAAACVACHSGRARPVRDHAGLYQDPPFAELAIGCENCHGPGKAHVASGGKGKSIVNPA